VPGEAGRIESAGGGNQKVGGSTPSGRAIFKMFFVYVLQNVLTGRHYTGFTTDLTQRLGQHNSGVTKSTKNRGSWELVYHEQFGTRADAMRREKQLKSGRGRKELGRILSGRADRGSAG
jgi:putative endonuclease